MIFLGIFFLVIVISYPIWDHYYMKKIQLEGINKWSLYRNIILTQWVSLGILLAYWLFADLPFRELFTYPDPLYEPESVTSFMHGMATSVSLVILVFIFSKSIRRKIAERFIDDSIAFLLPKTKKDRFVFLAVSLTAGVCEEIIFRGAMVYYLNQLSFDLSILVVGVISSIVFGIVHMYQGWKGIIGTTILGMGMYFLFVRTGSLWLPILAHFLIDAKFVFLPNVSSNSNEAKRQSI